MEKNYKLSDEAQKVLEDFRKTFNYSSNTEALAGALGLAQRAAEAKRAGTPLLVHNNRSGDFTEILVNGK